MSYVGNVSGNVPPPRQTCVLVDPMYDEAWGVEWGNLRPLHGGMGSWQRLQQFGGSCRKVQEQSFSTFCAQEAEVGEDDDEPDQTALCELVVGELPSIGSKDHAIGECKRCAFFFKGRCRNGKECSHCHLPHDQVRRKRNRRKSNSTSLRTGDNEDNEDYEGDLDDDIEDDVSIQLPATKAQLALVGTPVSMPAQTSSNGFDRMLVFGTVTPELQPQLSCAVASSALKIAEEDVEEDVKAPAVAFSSLWNVVENPSTSTPDETESDAEVSDAEASALEEMVKRAEEEAARLEEEAVVAEGEARRLLEEAAAAEKVQTPGRDNMSNDSKKEAETTASSEGNSSDAAATGHDSMSSCSAKADQASSDSDFGSDQDINQQGSNPKSPELCPQRPERRHRQTHKQISDIARSSSKRSPLWPSCLPTAGPVADSPMAKAVLPCQGEAKKAKTSWAALARARRQAAAEDPDVAVVRQARAILNKLTDANFETLYKQFVECGVRTATQLEAIIMEIFEKATVQHGFLPMYVELCVKLNSHFQNQPVDGTDFRKVLVGACQQTFEKTLRTQPKVDPSLSYEDRYEVELKFKTRMLGNLRFVGELLVRKLLSGKVLLAVSEELLSVGDAASIEAAATLLTVAGPAFDRKSWVFHPRLCAIFSMIRGVSKDKAIPMRVRCILKDLLDLRDAGWQKS